MGYSPCCPRCHKNMPESIAHPKSPVQRLRHFFLYSCNPQAGAVAVHFHRIPFHQQLYHRLFKAFRRGHGRIPQAVVKYIFIANFFSPRRSILRKFPNHWFPIQHFFILFCNHFLPFPPFVHKSSHSSCRIKNQRIYSTTNHTTTRSRTQAACSPAKFFIFCFPFPPALI